MRSRWLWSGAIVGLLIAGLLVAVRLWPRAPTGSSEQAKGSSQSIALPPVPEPTAAKPPADAAASAQCAECHAEIVKSFSEHPMGRSAASTLSAPVEDYARASFEPAPGLTLSVERTSEGVVHRETRRAGQEVLYDRKVPMSWAIGSGQRGRSYAFEVNGKLFMSPISWYAEKGKWDLSPGYAADRPNLFGRPAVDGCVACHFGRMNPRPGAPNRYEEPVVLEPAIGCDRCHGDSADHIRRHKSGKALTGKDPILNPARLDPPEREAVCNQCHLQGYRRIPRSGRSPHDFRPGQRLDSVWTVFVEPSRGGGTAETAQAVSQVEQMRASRCFQESAGAMGCISCHNPHARVPASARGTHYERRCFTCHETQDCTGRAASTRSCIDCHMPRLTASDVPHTSQTDHRILRIPQSASSAAPPQPGPLEIFEVASTTVPEVELLRAQSLVRVADLERTRDPQLAERCRQDLLVVVAALEPDPDVLAGLAAASLVLGNAQAAESYWLKALKLRPADERVVQQLGVFYAHEGNASEARKVLRRALELNAWNPETWGRYAQVLAQEDMWTAAVEAGERGLAVDPSSVPLREWLAGAHQRLGNAATAERHRAVLEKMRRR